MEEVRGYVPPCFYGLLGSPPKGTDMDKKKSAFTLIELLVVISIIALLLGILVPVLGSAKKKANILKEAVNLRSIHMALATYSNTNKGWFAGIDAMGRYQGYDVATTAATPFIGKYYAAYTNGTSVASAAFPGVGGQTNGGTTPYAQAILLDEGMSVPAHWISPGEPGLTGGSVATELDVTAATKDVAASTDSASTGLVNVFNNSFAVLGYGSATLKPEWQSNQNQKAVVLGTRMIGASVGAFDVDAQHSFNTGWTEVNSGIFSGSFVRGDSSTVTDKFRRSNADEPFGSLRYGSTSGTVPVTATAAGVVGVFAHVTVTTGVATYGTNAGNLGVAAVSGVLTTGEIASGLN